MTLRPKMHQHATAFATLHNLIRGNESDSGQSKRFVIRMAWTRCHRSCWNFASASLGERVMNQRPFVWPHGHRVAVVCSVLLETWSEGKSPSYFPRTTPLPSGSKDIAGINWSRFGGNEGIWRLSRILKDLDVPATLFCNGRSAEVWPDAVSAFAKAGHDVAGHGYLQDQTLFSMNADRERETIKKTLDILEKTAGKRPTGWVTPIYGWSENTIDYLAEAKLQWC